MMNDDISFFIYLFSYFKNVGETVPLGIVDMVDSDLSESLSGSFLSYPLTRKANGIATYNTRRIYRYTPRKGYGSVSPGYHRGLRGGTIMLGPRGQIVIYIIQIYHA